MFKNYRRRNTSLGQGEEVGRDSSHLAATISEPTRGAASRRLVMASLGDLSPSSSYSPEEDKTPIAALPRRKGPKVRMSTGKESK